MSKKVKDDDPNMLCRYNEGVMCDWRTHYNCHKCGFSRDVHDKRVAKIRAELRGEQIEEQEESE